MDTIGSRNILGFEIISQDGFSYLSPTTVKCIVVTLLCLVVVQARLFSTMNYRPLYQSKFDRVFKPISILSAILVWFHTGEVLGIAIRYLPQNSKLPVFVSEKPSILVFILYIVVFIIWILHFLILSPPKRFHFHLSALILYTFEILSLCIYQTLLVKNPLVLLDYTMELEYIIAAVSRWIMILLIIMIWFLIRYRINLDEQDITPFSMENFNPPSTWTDFLLHLRKLIPFAWPTGPNTIGLQLMMFLSFVSMVLGRYVNVMVPIQYKKVVDALSEIAISNYLVNLNVNFQLDFKLPLDKILMFVLYRLLAGSSGILGSIQSALWIPIGQYTTKKVSLDMFKHLHRLSLRFHLNRKTGEILRVQDRGVSSIVSLLSSIFFNVVPTLADIFIACIYFSIEFDLYFGFIVFTTMISYICITIWLTEWRTKYRRAANQLENEMEAKAVDSLLNFETVKYYNAENFEANMYEKSIDAYQFADLISSATMWILDTLQNVIIQIGLLIGCLLCAKRVMIDKTMTVGDFVLYLSYLTQLYGPLNYFGNYYKTIQKNFVDMEKMMDLFEEEIEIKDVPNAPPIVVSNPSIEFRDVHFAYDARKPILKNISFVVPQGHTVALVGQSGSGKSTLLKLLFRFFDVEKGTILIDGQDIQKCTQDSLRHTIGVVPQDTILFNADIKYNVLYGRPDAKDVELNEAAIAAQIHDRIMSFPDGYQTKVGERGLRLSGGEKQRVAIARTLLKNPLILLLDEATSALDSHSESLLQQVLLTQGKTCLVVAHRLSTIRNANMILVMKHGEIIERGTHDELMELGKEYFELWTKQQKTDN